MSNNTQAQPTPDELTAENELICENLLGWKRVGDGDCWEQHSAPWLDSVTPSTPSFTTWADVGLILDAMSVANIGFELGHDTIDDEWFCELQGRKSTWDKAGPLAIRSAALGYIRSLP
jgi:hypothetical protein